MGRCGRFGGKAVVIKGRNPKIIGLKYGDFI